MLYQILLFITHAETKSSYNNNKFKIAPTWNDKFELPDESYSVSNIQDYFKYILKKHGEDVDEPLIQMKYVNEIENIITFKIKDGYSLELLTPETIKVLGSTKNKITKDKSDENVPHLDITEVVLVHCNIVSNDYLQHSRVLYTFIPDKPFGSLLKISPTKYNLSKIFNSEYE